MVIKILFLLSLIILPFNCLAEHIDLPRDASGWTIFTPSASTQIMYVDPNSVGTGTVYTTANHPNWSNPFQPGAIDAYPTYAAAFANMREGYPDWILVKRGTTLTEDISGYENLPEIRFPKGKNANEPSLLGAYGTSGASPIIQTGPGAIALRIWGSKSYMAISGIDFYAYTRDPANPGYIAPPENLATSSLKFFSVGPNYIFDGLLVEGCKFRYYHQVNIAVTEADYATGARIKGIKFRRNLFLDSWTQATHSQGIYAQLLDDLTLEENVFDHNGWLTSEGEAGTPGKATIFSHNNYIYAVASASLSGNIYTRPSSIGATFSIPGSKTATVLATAEIDNNLFVDCEVGLGINADPQPAPWGLTTWYGVGASVINDGGVYTSKVGYTSDNTSEPGTGASWDTYWKYEGLWHGQVTPWINTIVTNNVFSNMGKTGPTNRNFAEYMTFLNQRSLTASNNLLINQEDNGVSGNNAIKTRGVFNDSVIQGNVLYNLQTLDSFHMDSSYSAAVSNSSIANNTVWTQDNPGYTVRVDYDPAGWSFSGNKWFSSRPDGLRFRINGVDQTSSQWIAETGDNSTWEQPVFTDALRDVDTYMTSISAPVENQTIEGFITAIRTQDRYSWNLAYTAPVINSWIRAGFDMEEPTCTNTPSMCTPLNCVANEWYLHSDDICRAYPEGVTPDPTCSDGIQNGDETGVDCGGSCPACDGPPSFINAIRVGTNKVRTGTTPIVLQ